MKKTKKLTLSRTTLAKLIGRDLERVVAGDGVKPPGGMNSRCADTSVRDEPCGGQTDPGWTCGCTAACGGGPGGDGTTGSPTFTG